MSLTFDQLCEKVKPLYPDVQKVGDTVLRYARTDERAAFAVNYLDLGSLPDTPDELSDYLDRVIGKRYFEGASSLQWNNYLYFIRSSEQLKNTAVRKTKEFVEQDRKYARKFVISESELDSVLRPNTLQADGTEKTSDPVATWYPILQEAHLVDAVLDDQTLPKRMKLIEQPMKSGASQVTPLATTSPGTLLPPIGQFVIEEFDRSCPEQRVFDFVDVNLLFGANGTGKTSLLEAIELFYCGKTRRNPKVSEHYKFKVSMNGETQSISQERKLKTLRKNNLVWYGVSEKKSTKLYDGFGRFNFLNTDAAIELSQSSYRIDEYLAKLLVGSDAAKTWQVIEKLSERVKSELGGLQTLHQQVSQELDLLNKQIAEICTVKKESDSLRAALREALGRNKWADDDDLASKPGELIAELVELHAVSEQVGDLPWLDTPVTLDIIETYVQVVKQVSQTCAPYIEKIKKLQITHRQLAEAVERDQETVILLDELARLIETGVEQRTSELAEQREVIDAYSNLTAEVDDETLRVVAEANGNLSTEEFHLSAATAQKHAEKALLAARQEYGDSVKLRDRSLSLEQELRATAARILEERPSDECPLCHTKFQAGELAHHIVAGVDEQLETKAQKLLEDVYLAEESVSNAAANEKAANQISSLCTLMQLAPGTALKDAILSFDNAKVTQAEARKRVEALASEIRILEAQGLSLSRLNEVSASLNEQGINLQDRSQQVVSSLRNDFAQRLAASRSQMEATQQEEQQLQESVNQAACTVLLGEADPVVAVAELNERLAETRAVYTALKRFLHRFRWEGARPIVEWMVQVDTVRGIASQLHATLEKERIAAETKSDADQRRDKLTQQDNELAGRVDRFSKVLKALTEIQTKHSLEALTDSALQTNRRSIETIFAQIHSPAEFKEIGSNWTLIRKLDDIATPLTRISTGQRAAFALSVFLAQNAQLKVGPRVILIDDPIAHVDDLNCLSFLDYLREIVLTGKRQIFFATASDKLASLVERKFDFLSNRFKRFNLTRSDGD